MTTRANDTAVGQQVLALLGRYQAAAAAKDVDALLALYAPDAQIYDCWDQWSYDGEAQWRGAVERWFKMAGEGANRVVFDEPRVHASGDMAALHAFVRYELVVHGETKFTMDNRISWTLLRREGAWKIVHEHTSTPLAGEDMKGVINRTA